MKTKPRTLIDFKVEKSNTFMGLTSLHGQVLQDFMKALKFEVNQQIEQNPGNEDQIRTEEKAILHYWKAQKDIWTAHGKQLAIDTFGRTANTKRQRDESAVLELANVSLNCIPLSNPHSYFYTDLYSKETFQKTKLLAKQTTKSIRKTTVSKVQQRSCHQRRKIFEKIPSSEKRAKIRRMPKFKQNCIKLFKSQMNDFQLESKEFQLEKENIKRLGVAHTNVHNICNQSITQKELDSLSLGHKFIPTPKKRPMLIEKALKNFLNTIRWKCIFDDDESEMPLYWIPSTKKPQISNQYVESAFMTLQNEINMDDAKIIFNMHPILSKSLSKLLKHKDILVITADKNLGYAIVSISWYRQQCLNHLESQSYIELTNQFMRNDEGAAFIDELYNQLVTLVNEYRHILDTIEEKWIIQKHDWAPMRFYILAKVHKYPVKGRPIVPSMTWITHHLSQWIANQLNPLISHLEWVLKDSNDLLKEFHQVNTSKKFKNKYLNLELYSADVEALYPNMDVQTGITLINDFLHEIGWEHQIKIDFILKAIEFVLTQGYIIFENRIFQQCNGAAMGSPMIPPYANIYMYMLERNVVNKFTATNFVLLYKRFLDDIFVVIDSHNKNLISEFQNELNSLHPKIKLLWTPKSTRCNFLDINIWITPKNYIHTNVYQKPLNMYSYLPFKSFHTPSQKTGFIKAEALRYSRICSRKSDFRKMIHLFTIRLQRRGYPLDIINKALLNVTWENRVLHLFKESESKKNIPLLFKIRYSPTHNHIKLRKALNNFTNQMIKGISVPKSLKNKVTICYQLPRKLHSRILKARKAKGF